MGNVPSSTSALSSTTTFLTTSSLLATTSLTTASTLKTSAASSSTIIPARSDGRCGSAFGGASCVGSQYGTCCSQYGWCGSTDAYCLPSNGCQNGCKGSSSSSSKTTLTTTTSKSSSTTTTTTPKTSSTTSSTTTTTPKPSTTTTTSTTTSTTLSTTTRSSTTTTTTTTTTTSSSASASSSAAPRSDGRCGSAYGGATCDPNGQFGGCCSQYGWCGTGDAYCLPANGCQSGCTGSGSSSSSKTSTTTKTTTTTTTTPASTFTRQATYNANNWFSSFTAQGIAGNDPTHGFVNYLSDADGQAAGIYKTVGNQVYIGVDNSTVLSPSGPGRKSMRIYSNAAYHTGLFILDLAHAPSAQCGSWPAYWLLGTGTWPGTGEIDVYEGVNTNTQNQYTLHTSPGCVVNVGPGGQAGQSGSATDCGLNGGYNGCNVVSQSTATYGNGFNNVGGGVYALYWTGTQIRIWFFPRSGGIPSDITSGAPNPSGWPTPQANFGGCSFANYMKDPMNIIFNIDFCGDWAAGVWGNSCQSSTGTTCPGYVAANPHAYDQAYFLINSLSVYAG